MSKDKKKRLLCRKEVAYIFNVSHSTTYRMEKAKRLPSRVPISPGRVGWYEDEIEKALQDLRKPGLPDELDEFNGENEDG